MRCRPGPTRTLSLCSDWQISKFKRAAHRLQFTQPHIIYFLENCFQRIYQNDENTSREGGWCFMTAVSGADTGPCVSLLYWHWSMCVSPLLTQAHVCLSSHWPMCDALHHISVLMLLSKRFKAIRNGIRRRGLLDKRTIHTSRKFFLKIIKQFWKIQEMLQRIIMHRDCVDVWGNVPVRVSQSYDYPLKKYH